MLTDDDLKKIDELLRPNFDSISNKLDVLDRRLKVVEKRLEVVEKRLDNLAEVVATHTDMLKDINFRVVTIERHTKSHMQYIQNMDSDIGLHEQRLSELERISGVLNTLHDEGKNRYKKINS